jgi:Dyp-type peroxidase family
MSLPPRSIRAGATRNLVSETVAGIELAEIQGNIVRGYNFPRARFVFASFGSAEAGRRWLASLVNEVTDGSDWGPERPATTLNLAFTFEGLKALGLAAESLASFPDEFRKGIVAQAEELGDTGSSSPANWEDGLGSPDGVRSTHVLVSLHALEAQALAERAGRVLDSMATHGLSVVHNQEGGVLPGGVEHFGYRDGIGEPPIGWAGHPGDGVPQRDGTWSALAPGEFLLGLPAQDGQSRPVPFPQESFGKYGSYLVYRKLAQDVSLFRRYVDEASRRLRRDPEWIGSRMIGRWRDGTPITLSPDAPDPAIAEDRDRVNDFRFGPDSSGMRCPIGAHVRRANPRDGFASGAAAVEGHRIARRGIPYGPPAPAGFEDDGVDRGLIFVAYNASIREQFAFLQRLWIASGHLPRLDPSHKDPLVGHNDGTGRMTIPMAGFPRTLLDLPRFVTVRFGAYLFVPGIQGLRFLAAARGPAPLA